jgi:hypothetical protein
MMPALGYYALYVSVNNGVTEEVSGFDAKSGDAIRARVGSDFPRRSLQIEIVDDVTPWSDKVVSCRVQRGSRRDGEGIPAQDSRRETWLGRQERGPVGPKRGRKWQIEGYAGHASCPV